jgi:AcrR family transcriptional regulator
MTADTPRHHDERPSSQSQACASLEASLELLWEGRRPSSKGPRPTLTLEQIVDTAIEVADANGIEAVSMRRIARELGVGAMSLYRYVPDKSVLLDLMLDRVAAPSDARREVTRRSWRDVLEAEAWEGRALYLRHPWLLQVNWSRPVLGPNTVAGMELVMSGVGSLPITDREKIMVLSILDAYVTGSVRQQILYENAAEETGLNEEEFWHTQLPFLERAMASGRYPTMSSMAGDAFDAGWEETFVLGLRHLLDGLAADLARRASAADPRS